MAQGAQRLAQSALRSRDQDSAKGIWRVLQVIFWMVGAFIFMALLFWPSLGVLLFWNVLIPVAPALLVIATGFWRNVCPLATTNLLPRYLGISKQQLMPRSQQAWLSLLAVVALYTIVPLRHAVFNQSGLATAMLLAGCVAAGWLLGRFYDWKSGWCSSLCPVHPVEKFYGTYPSITFVNAHCAACVNCTVPCPDSTPNISPAKTAKAWQHRAAAVLIIGGLPGFIWGWFQVPDEINAQYSFYHLAGLYALPLAGLLMSIVLYLAMRKLIRPGDDKKLTAVFAAAAVSTYYWFRIPALFGFGQFNKDGLLIDLTAYLQAPAILAFKLATVSFFFWWLVWKKQPAQSWTSRPVFAKLKALSSGK
jgi:hypothetical protein